MDDVALSMRSVWCAPGLDFAICAVRVVQGVYVKKAVAVAQTSRRHRMLSLCFDVFCGLLFMLVKSDEPTGGIWLFNYSKFWKKGPVFVFNTISTFAFLACFPGPQRVPVETR